MITKGLGKLNAVSYIETISTKNITNNEIVYAVTMVCQIGMKRWLRQTCLICRPME